MKKILALTALCLLTAPEAGWAQVGTTVTTGHAIYGCSKSEDFVTLNTMMVQQQDKVTAAHFGDSHCRVLPNGTVGVIANTAPQMGAVCLQPRGEKICLWVPATVVR